MSTYKKTVQIIGGGTVSHVRNHLGLAAMAYGATARKLAKLCREYSDKLDVELHLTEMANRGVLTLPSRNIGLERLETPEDVSKLVDNWKQDPDVKIIFFNVALADYSGYILDTKPSTHVPMFFKPTNSGKYEGRLHSREGNQFMQLEPNAKMLGTIRNGRKDIHLVGFKTTCGATEDEQYLAALNLLKETSCNLVFANDTKTRLNMIVTPEEARYHVTKDRDLALKNLVEMAYLRSHLSFTRSTVVAGEAVPWSSSDVPQTLRDVVNYCIDRGAYKPFRGATVGHFAAKIGPNTFLTSRRKTNFNEINKLGLVKVVTDGPDRVTAYGFKPSVGGQSQRIVFDEHKDLDCIVHFHSPIKAGSLVPTASQREVECGSHQCGANTSAHLQKFGNLYAVYLDNHGPNIVFNRSIDPQEVINFIENNFDLTQKTGGPVSLSLEKIQ